MIHAKMQKEVETVHYKRSVFRSLAMVTQLGFSVLTPILLCVYTGYLVDSHFWDEAHGADADAGCSGRRTLRLGHGEKYSFAGAERGRALTAAAECGAGTKRNQQTKTAKPHFS